MAVLIGSSATSLQINYNNCDIASLVIRDCLLDLKREGGQTSGNLSANFKSVPVVGHIAEYLSVEQVENGKTSKPIDRWE